MKKRTTFFLISAALISCSRTATPDDEGKETEKELVSLQEVAQVLSSVELGVDRCQEVYDAVCASSENGYDSEYTMASLLETPGYGVGEEQSKASRPKTYSRPLRDVFIEHYSAATKGSGGISANEYLEYISSSGMQIYWPDAENWDGAEAPTITFDPLSEKSENVGYVMGENGLVKEVTVTEEYAFKHPVWVINNNDDAGSVTLDILRRDHPEWEQGGNITIGQEGMKAFSSAQKSDGVKTLVMKDFTMHRQYDNWFRGASEFYIKTGKVESFTASVLEDLYLYSPSITDFMLVVKRKELGQTKALNTVLVSEWTSQLQNVAFMIIEDDGGKRTTWKCSAVVKYNSKSFGYEIELPFNSKDDVVWRGSLTRNYIESSSNITSRFGDVSITFSIQ